MFFKIRMRAHAGLQREIIRADIVKGLELIAPAAANKEKVLESIAISRHETNKSAVGTKLMN